MGFTYGSIVLKVAVVVAALASEAVYEAVTDKES